MYVKMNTISLLLVLQMKAAVEYVRQVLVFLLSLELFIMGVQANKLHFCYLELILNKTGYSHIMENKKKFIF